MHQIFWLSKSVFSWRAEFDLGHLGDIGRVKRPHELLAHSDRQLSSGHDEFMRADAVLNLKRAINSRLQHLEELYGFSAAFPKSVGALERLEVVGLARPFLIRQLFALRNDIEHNDSAPPIESKCRELVDSTWYFLKSTDYACKLVPLGVALRLPDTSNATGFAESVTIRVTAFDAEVELLGKLSGDTLSSVERPGFLPIREESTQVGELAKAFALSAKEPCLASNPGTDGCRPFFGRAVASPEIMRVVWRLMLETL